VLARIAADRQILALHTPFKSSMGYRECPTCGSTGVDGDGSYCPTAKLFALPHADRPGFREEWKP
jgi:hypothetical protein